MEQSSNFFSIKIYRSKKRFTAESKNGSHENGIKGTDFREEEA